MVDLKFGQGRLAQPRPLQAPELAPGTIDTPLHTPLCSRRSRCARYL